MRNLYAGDTIEEAAWRVGATQGIGSQWLERWNENAQDGLIPGFGGGQPPKLSHQQARDLKRLLEEGQPWTTAEIKQLIEDEFGISYHSGSIQRLLRNTYRMSYAIPRPEMPSRPENAEILLADAWKRRSARQQMTLSRRRLIPERLSWASFDASWPMPTDNKHRVWAFGTPRVVKQMPQVKIAAVGFYAVNGTGVLRSLESLHKERIGEVFETIREQNSTGRILLVLDNFFSHTSTYTREKAEELGISLVFLPVASPHLQPIKPVWNSLKRYLSPISTESADEFRALVEVTFLELTHRLSFAADWLGTFIDINRLR